MSKVACVFPWLLVLRQILRLYYREVILAVNLVVWAIFTLECDHERLCYEPLVLIMCAASVLSSVAVFRAFDLELGYGEPAGNWIFRYSWVMLLCLVCQLGENAIEHLSSTLSLPCHLQLTKLFHVVLYAVVPFCSRGFPLFIQLVVSTTDWKKGSVFLPELVCVCTGQTLSCFTLYMHDQRVIACFRGLQLAVIHAIDRLNGGQLCVVSDLAWIMFTLLWGYFTILTFRKQRHLPKRLAGAKFVSWRYLRALSSRGQMMRRCQDLPVSAFGDVRKAMHVITVSHRWFDPRANDVATRAFPAGVKLSTILQRFEEHFWQQEFSWSVLAVSTADVLVFFDYMSLPQEGIDEYGNVVPRTTAEQVAFDTCLPYMGTLYSRFPVLVLAEVFETASGLHGYDESGWCLCEFMIAGMGKQLHQLSAASLELSGHLSVVRTAIECVLDGGSKDAVLNIMCSLLERSCFGRESDRSVTIGIVTRFLVKRRLIDAVHCGDAATISQLLGASGLDDLEAILDEPVDNEMNTLLHIGVMAGHANVCLELLRHGAQPSAQNIFGDTPVQRLIFPRRGPAARVLRPSTKSASPEMAAHS
eukprot:TRINITY_DN36950_c0_g1_i1.p1 TRINITY_DN36950_c0_g1~~TRINITY_DN36950_c0_g1_i1.p1  ORF type:complete len:587 (+),score=52.18 TRINITY_DN36950_c0_g1_i1:61-1821(+)